MRPDIMDFPGLLLPAQSELQLVSLTLDPASDLITLHIVSTQTTAHCPLCHHPTQRVHSQYQRTLKDLAWANYQVILELHLQKFFCVNAACHRQIFVERLPDLTVPWARRTNRLATQLSQIGLALGGSAGARLCHKLGYSVCRNTVLNAIPFTPLPEPPPPKIVGVDDFAFKKCLSYGTLIVDIDRHRPIALLEDEHADTLADWLKQHPEIETLARDRSKTYRQGMNQGAPQAIQVADRFHLIQNLANPLQAVFLDNSNEIMLMKPPEPPDPPEPPGQADSSDSPPEPVSPPNPAPSSTHKRQARFQKVWELRRNGCTILQIAEQVGIGERTVRRLLQQEEFTDRQRRSDRGQIRRLKPFLSQLQELWDAGLHEARPLFRKLQQLGYPGSYPTVARYVRQLRQAQGLEVRPSPRPRIPRQPADKASPPPLTPRKAVWLVLRRPEKRSPQDERQLDELRQLHPAVNTSITLAEDFIQMARNLQGQNLDDWLKKALDSGLAPFVRFAESLDRDYDAVKAGLTLPISNGPTEGHINRLKTIKRQMYGRAGLWLLRYRFLLACLRRFGGLLSHSILTLYSMA